MWVSDSVYLSGFLDDFGLVSLNASGFSVLGGTSSFTLGLQQRALVEIRLYALTLNFYGGDNNYCIG